LYAIDPRFAAARLREVPAPRREPPLEASARASGAAWLD